MLAAWAISALVLTGQTAAQARLHEWQFEGPAGGGVQYQFSIASGGGTNKAVNGVLTGGFNLIDDALGYGWLSGVSVTADKTAFSPSNVANATQNDVGGPETYTNGYITPYSGNVQTLYLWNTYTNNNQTYARGLQLSFFAGDLSSNGGVAILGIASTANDNFCKQIVGGTNNALPVSGSVAPTGCTAAKNNLYNINGSIASPSPAIGLGLAPLAMLSRRRRRRCASANDAGARDCPASQPQPVHR